MRLKFGWNKPTHIFNGRAAMDDTRLIFYFNLHLPLEVKQSIKFSFFSSFLSIKFLLATQGKHKEGNMQTPKGACWKPLILLIVGKYLLCTKEILTENTLLSQECVTTWPEHLSQGHLNTHHTQETENQQPQKKM